MGNDRFKTNWNILKSKFAEIIGAFKAKNGKIKFWNTAFKVDLIIGLHFKNCGFFKKLFGFFSDQIHDFT